jgi:hypothetical protein
LSADTYYLFHRFKAVIPLGADYIDYLLALPDTPQPVKSQLMGLSSDPAFKRAGGE